MKYFVCSDIHGFYTEWIKELEAKGFEMKNSNHKVIICGDLFDRGKEPKQIIDFILGNKDKFILIRGNHEDLLMDMINRNKVEGYDLTNGTAYTIIDLYPEYQISEFNLSKIYKETRLEELFSLFINYYETDNYVFVHSWIPIIENCYLYDAEWRNASLRRWEKARWVNPLEMYEYELFVPNKKIVLGHWHCSAFWANKYPNLYTEFGEKTNFEPYIDEHIIAIDACTTYSHKVNVMVLED